MMLQNMSRRTDSVEQPVSTVDELSAGRTVDSYCLVLFCRTIYVGNRPVTLMNNNSISTLMPSLLISAGKERQTNLHPVPSYFFFFFFLLVFFFSVPNGNF